VPAERCLVKIPHRAPMHRAAKSSSFATRPYNLIRLRAARGLTQRRFGAASGFCKTYIGDVEQGNVNVSLANLEALALGLDCSIINLVGRLSSEGFRRGDRMN
jgi:transcriptional regulator with XRE-family HTH domain